MYFIGTWEFPKIRCTGDYNQDPTIQGYYIRVPIVGNSYVGTWSPRVYGLPEFQEVWIISNTCLYQGTGSGPWV